MKNLPEGTRIRIYPISQSEFVDQIYAGLFDLDAERSIKLEFTNSPIVKIEERDYEFHIPTNKHIFYLEAILPGSKPFTMCLDMHDSPRTTSWSALLNCDVYVKRSFNRTFLEQHLADRGSKYVDLLKRIIPYGFNYQVVSQNERGRFRRLLALLIRQRRWASEPSTSLKSLTREASYAMFPSRFKLLQESKRLEVPASRFAAPKVLLQTRLIDPAIAKRQSGKDLVNEINETRVKYVKALKEALGDSFVGGIIPQGIARQYPEELMSREPYGRSDYLDLVEANRVVVYTMGRANSNGWRIGEYLAMSRCVVSESLHYEVPAPLEPGRNAIFFQTEDECVSACEALIQDEQLAKTMREANEAYYLNHLRPASIVRNAIKNGAELVAN